MSGSPLPDDPLLSLARRIDQLCDEFESAWLSGVAPQVEEFLGRVSENERPALLRELIALEIEHRQRRGETVAASELRKRFPDASLSWLKRTIRRSAER